MFWKLPSYIGQIVFTNCSFSNNAIDILQRFIILSSDQNSGSIFIKSISKRRLKNLIFIGISLLFTVSFKIVIHTKIIPVLIARMKDNPSRFIEYEPIFILIQNPSMKLVNINFLEFSFFLAQH